MNPQTRLFEQAERAYEYWRLVEVTQRSESLHTFQAQLANQEPALAAITARQLAQGLELLQESISLDGPTGETNELYLAPRGVTLLVQQQEGTSGRIAIAVQLIMALMAGNSVMLCSQDRAFVQTVEQAWQSTAQPTNLVQCCSLESYADIVKQAIRVTGFVGSEAMAIELNRRLAQKKGYIIPLVTETDMVQLPQAHDMMLLLRFCTERTRTINITAVGGNATLLELGKPPH